MLWILAPAQRSYCSHGIFGLVFALFCTSCHCRHPFKVQARSLQMSLHKRLWLCTAGIRAVGLSLRAKNQSWVLQSCKVCLFPYIVLALQLCLESLFGSRGTLVGTDSPRGKPDWLWQHPSSLAGSEAVWMLRRGCIISYMVEIIISFHLRFVRRNNFDNYKAVSVKPYDWWYHQCFKLWLIAKGWKEVEITQGFRAPKPALKQEKCRQVETGKLFPEKKHPNCLCLILPLMWQKSDGSTEINSSMYLRYKPSSHGWAHCVTALLIALT